MGFTHTDVCCCWWLQATAEIARITQEIAEAEATAAEFFLRRQAAEARMAELQGGLSEHQEEVDKLKKKLHKINSALVRSRSSRCEDDGLSC